MACASVLFLARRQQAQETGGGWEREAATRGIKLELPGNWSNLVAEKPAGWATCARLGTRPGKACWKGRWGED